MNLRGEIGTIGSVNPAQRLRLPSFCSRHFGLRVDQRVSQQAGLTSGARKSENWRSIGGPGGSHLRSVLFS